MITINSLTAYRHVTYFYGSDFYGTTWPFQSDYAGFDYVQHGTFQTVSQELQLVGTTSRLNWILGAFYLDDVTESGGYSFGLSPDPFPFPFTASGSLKKPTYALFGQATYKVTDRLGLTLGVRYGHETNTANNQWTSGGVVLTGFPPCATLPGGNCARVATVGYHSFTPRVEAHYQWTDGLMTYASFAEGYKSGGFQIETLSPPFLPSTVRTYEVGAKEVTADQRLSVTAAIFHSDYNNMQVNEVSNGFTTIVNAARSRIKGAELELAVKPVPGLTILDAAAYLDGRYLSFMEINPNFPFLGPSGIVNEAGHMLQEESKYTNNLRVTYKLPFGVNDVRAAVEWNWRSKMYFSEFNDPFELQPAYSLVNASLRYTAPNGKWYVEGFIKNIANSLIVSQESIGGCGCINSQYFPPRTYGLNLSYHY